MKCAHPRVVYDGTFKSEYPCGKCLGCRKSRTREWANRCMHELSSWDKSCFLTLTYDDDHFPKNGSLSKDDFKLFMKRLRKSLEPNRIKYFGCGEYGEHTQRPHYHFIIFGLAPSDPCFKFIRKSGKRSYYSLQSWDKGFVDVGSVTYKSCAYVAGYIQKKLGVSSYPGKVPPFQVQSQGLGYEYLKQNEKNLVENLSFTMNGAKCSLPRYYRKKLADRISQQKLNDLSLEKSNELHEFLKERGIEDEKEESIDDYRTIARAQKEKDMKAIDSIKKDRFL